MLNRRSDAAELLELLDFHPPNWRRHYEDLWARYPTLAGDWVHVGFLNLPVTGWPEQSEQELALQRRVEALKGQEADSVIVNKSRQLRRELPSPRLDSPCSVAR